MVVNVALKLEELRMDNKMKIQLGCVRLESEPLKHNVRFTKMFYNCGVLSQ